MDQFPQTRWTLINSLKDGSEESRERVWQWISENYWRPIYSFLRATGKSSEVAEDLTQQFFEKLLTENIIENASRERGKLRSLLLGALKRMLSDMERSNRTEKRGSGQELLSLDITNFELKYGREFPPEEDPEQIYQRCWAWSLVEAAHQKLADDFKKQDRLTLFYKIEPYLLNEDSRASYGQLAKELDSTEGAVRVLVHRLRRQLREFLEDEVRVYLKDESEVAPECHWVLETLQRGR